MTRPLQLTPSAAYEHIKESVVGYLEAAYRISHPGVYAERAEILRRRGAVAQDPFIEATPNFPTARFLADLEREHSEFIPTGLADLVQHGVPINVFALYAHQEAALLAAFGERPNLLVASGTGSGKTEAFLLPILADLLREAKSWTPVTGIAAPGSYDAVARTWLHSRRHETRSAALRAIVLYPMNALVNDQLSRLRRILARGASPDWQRAHLKGNVIHFGMYTSLARPTGHWSEAVRRTGFEQTAKKIADDWDRLPQRLRDTGNWPRPDSPEMLCRWDIQAAPPDVLVTNYSMLEYMLIRSIESPIFDLSRQWLDTDPTARLTLVLDEAHTYTGAKGTEVAHLVRRLKERLGLPTGSDRFRAIATSASIPNIPGADGQLSSFVADLFGEPAERFSLIRTPSFRDRIGPRVATEDCLVAYRRFHGSFDLRDPVPAMKQLAADLNLGDVDTTLAPQVALHALLEQSPDIAWVRGRTARNATPLDLLSNECWPGLGSRQDRDEATAGLLAAGSLARPSDVPDVPPLLSMRVHGFFRGIGGLWACLNPDCPEVLGHHRDPDSARPIGKLYTDPRPWCSPRCGARVLELFSCRHCGLLFVGGIPDTRRGSLWPWSDDFGGGRQDLKAYQVFGVERPFAGAPPNHRSFVTTLHTHANDVYVRDTYEIQPATTTGNRPGGTQISPFPLQCPRCHNWRAPGADGREVIEPLRTKGPRTFSIAAEDGFRVQPRAGRGEPPNYGRKALLFADSRTDAAALAAELRQDHANDIFRQLLFRILHSCPRCSGSGEVASGRSYVIGEAGSPSGVQGCPDCAGSGSTPRPGPLGYNELRGAVIKLQIDSGIDPTRGRVSGFFDRLTSGDLTCYAEAELDFDLALRRELAEDDFALEPLGLASWRVKLPETTGSFPLLTEDETRAFLRSLARLLATERILLPPQPRQPWEWPKDLVRSHDRKVMIPASGAGGNQAIVPYNLLGHRKIGRYVNAVSDALFRDGRLADKRAAEAWCMALQWPLWKALQGFQILQWAGANIGNQVPHGVRIDSFELHPIGDLVHRCRACGYVMSETVLDVCIRCGQRTREVPVASLTNIYRRAALQALPNSLFDDPYPLRAIEHTAQIDKGEARDLERWFQDLFQDHQNPRDYRIDILSVTTTMEMGIDIGSLLSVGMRNVPPTVANYQQRAGRAGRRGSAIATVLTFAQQRSHDQYYFDRPPEIVSDAPRPPLLHLANEVIAQRHVRSLLLQDFFRQQAQGPRGRGLFNTWGTVREYETGLMAIRLDRYLKVNQTALLERCRSIVHEALHALLPTWFGALVGEIGELIRRRDPQDDILDILITGGLLPKYAFPVDVVSLSVPSFAQRGNDFEGGDEAMTRDLKIAIAEYAPGAEVIRGVFPKTYILESVGIYDPYERQPTYRPTGMLVECLDCQGMHLIGSADPQPDQCPECQGFNITILPWLRPPGFTVDLGLPNGGASEYDGGGRERAGVATPARLLIGQNSLSAGTPRLDFAPRLFSYVRVGELFTCNKGIDPRFPGFLICPDCGRALDPTAPGPHSFPNSLPPHRGANRGPRAGSPCRNRTYTNQVILGHRFHCEVLLLGTDLPPDLDAPYREPSGKAVWYSFGTLVANAASRVLQIDPSEIKVGTRPVRRADGRITGEVFIYDDVPGGAGYARAIEANLEEILTRAQALGRDCSNPNCAGACYHCLLDYRNQTIHQLLDRSLGTSVLEFVLEGKRPVLDRTRVDAAAEALSEFARANWTVTPGTMVGSQYFPRILRDAAGQRVGVWVLHPLVARPSLADKQAILAAAGLQCAAHTVFDLERRPLWVLNNLVT